MTGMKARYCESLLELISDAVVQIDARGHIRAINPAFTALLGYDAHDIKGRHFTELRHDFEGRDSHLVDLITDYGLYFLDKAEHDPLPMIFRHAKGFAVEVQLRSLLERTSGGDFTGAICILRHSDMVKPEPLQEDQEALSRRLWEMEQNYRSILENSGDAIIIADFNGRVVAVNPALLQLLGYASAEDLIGKFVMELGPMSGTFTSTTGEPVEIDARAQDEQRRVADTLFEKGRVATELYLFRADGAILPAETTMSLLQDRSGLRRGTVVICRDCTTRRLIERELRSARDELEQKVQERTLSLEEVNTALRVLLNAREEDRQELEKKIVATIHRFVTPYLDKLRSTHLNQQQKAYLQIVDTNLTNVLSPYLDRLDNRCMHLTPAELQAAQFIKEGKSTKDIAAILTISPQTVETYRKRIRRKLGLQNSKTNLRSFLSSLT